MKFHITLVKNELNIYVESNFTLFLCGRCSVCQLNPNQCIRNLNAGGAMMLTFLYLDIQPTIKSYILLLSLFINFAEFFCSFCYIAFMSNFILNL